MKKFIPILFKVNIFIGIFQGFWLQISIGNFKNTLFFQNTSMVASELNNQDK